MLTGVGSSSTQMNRSLMVQRSVFACPMPERYRTPFKVQGAYDLNPTLAGTDSNAAELGWLGNGLISVGPLLNYPLGTAGSYANNFPTGLYYLLGSDGAAGASSGLYGQYLVHGCTLEVQVVPVGTSNKPLQLVLYPADNTSATTMTTTQCAEQPYAVRGVIAPTLTSDPATFRLSQSTAAQLGLDRSLVRPGLGNNFTGTYNSNASSSQQWNVRLRLNNLDVTTTSYNVAVRWTIVYDVELFDLNTLSTSAPT